MPYSLSWRIWVTGLRILRAIVAGERAPRTFAQYRDYRMPSSADTIAKALEGDDRAEHVFTLTPSLELSDFTQQQIAACAQEIERVLGTLDSQVDPAEHPFPPPTTTHRHPQRNEPAFDLRTHLYRITGVDLTQVPGLQAPTIHIIRAAVGLNRHTWPTDKHCAAWLGLCPDNQMSGGKVLSTGSRRVHNRASRALRMAAQSLRTSPSSLGAFYRRMRSTLGPAKATTATAHQLAQILSPMLQEKTPYRAHGAEEYRHQDHERQLRQVRQQAKHVGCALVPQPTNEYARSRRDNGEECQNIPDDGRRDRARRAPYVRCSAFSIPRPGSETDAPLVALSPCVSVVPSAHDYVTGEASGLCRTAIP